jgi:hypothetical protein
MHSWIFLLFRMPDEKTGRTFSRPVKAAKSHGHVVIFADDLRYFRRESMLNDRQWRPVKTAAGYRRSANRMPPEEKFPCLRRLCSSTFVVLKQRSRTHVSVAFRALHQSRSTAVTAMQPSRMRAN